MQFNAVQCTNIKCNAIEYRAMQCAAVQCNAMLCDMMLLNIFFLQYFSYNPVSVSVRGSTHINVIPPLSVKLGEIVGDRVWVFNMAPVISN